MIRFLTLFAAALIPLCAAEWRGFPTGGNFSSRSLSRESRQNGGITVTLYDHTNYEGDTKTASIGNDCTNVVDFNDRASSVRVSSGCVKLWQDINCQGRSVEIRSPGEPNLPGRDFNDETTSVSSCDFPCYKENVEIVMHLNGANDLSSHAESIRKMMLEWFPFIQSQLYTPAYRSIPKIDVYFDEKDNGIYASGREIHIPQNYVRNNKGDTGVFIHEMTHVIHQARGCPGWVVEGTAEYMRRWFYEPKTTPTKPTHEEMNNDYVGDWLLYYLTSYNKRPLFYMITKACQEGSWRPNFIKDLTGKDEREWWRIMVRDNEYPWKRVR